MKIVELHPEADEELLEASAWYLARSASAAANFVRDVDHVMSRIAEAPERYPLTRFGRRRFVLLNFPYDIVYRITSTKVEIVAIAHHSRRPGYWRSR